MKMYLGIDPGFSGAWGIVTYHGKYQSCGDMLNNGKHILSRDVHAEIVMAIDRQDMYGVIESVHSMPAQGVASSFKFGVAFGMAIAIMERINCPWMLVTPQEWKKDMGLTSDKTQSLEMARRLWPNAPLARQMDNGRAEALLMAEWLRRQEHK